MEPGATILAARTAQTPRSGRAGPTTDCGGAKSRGGAARLTSLAGSRATGCSSLWTPTCSVSSRT
eukprot:1312732-Pyramimonas_sp.AAC.1